MILSEKNQKILLALSRDTLEGIFTPEGEAVLSTFEQTPFAQDLELKCRLPCFVTLLLKNGDLRGCIGSLQTDDPLYVNVHRYTQSSALDDPRFSPVRENEVSQIQIGISVLGPSEPLPSPESIQLGLHGLVVSSGRRRGVLLAKVAVENHWNRHQFIEETCIKAGLAPELWTQYRIEYFEELSFEEPVLMK